MNLLVGNKTVEAMSHSLFAAEPTAASRKHRIANIERLRILSAFAVASFHTDTWFPRSLGVVGFIILLLSFCAFVVNRPEPYGLSSLLERKAQRLLKPWLFWSVIYGGLGLVKVFYKNVPFSEVFSPWMLLTGARLHLWFLPFAFVAALLLVLVHRRMVCIRNLVHVIAATSVGALCILSCAIVQSRLELPTPLRQWTLGLPAIPLGYSIGRITLWRRREDRRNLYMFVVVSTMVPCIALLALARLDHSSVFATRYFVSVALVCFALHWQGNMHWISRELASLSYGIYLLHPLVLAFLCEFGVDAQHPLVMLFLVLSISALVTLIIKKTPMRQFV